MATKSKARKGHKSTKSRPYAGKKRAGTIIKSKGRYRKVYKLASGKKVTRACKAPKKAKG